MKNKALSSDQKFDFTLEFQLEVLRFYTQSKESPLLLSKVKSNYFTLIEHSIIYEAILKFYNRYHKIPSKPLLIESFHRLLQKREYVDLVLKDDIPNITRIIQDLYDKPLQDEEVIQDKIYKFSAFIEMRLLNERMDLTNFDLYEDYQNQVANIIRKSLPQKEEDPLMMVEGTIRRQMMRKIDPDIVQTPYWQLNKLSNGNGYSRGSIFVLLDKPKAKKTFSLINIARGYLAMKKNVLYIDTENGKNQIMERMVQSTLNKTKLEILSGEFDKLEQKHMRKYKRLGVDFIVERVPALVADSNYIKNLIQKVEANSGIKINVLIIDYAAKLASTLKDREDTERISNVYIDLDNLATECNIDHIWTAQHVKREASSHKETRYEDNDIASAISIVRHAQCILGLNSTQDEEDNGIQRLEVVVQRDGVPYGRCLFNIDLDRQRWKEFSRDARKAYDEIQGKLVDEMIKKSSSPKSLKKVNPDANPDKRKKTSGDI